MKKEPLISIIIPYSNSEKYLSECIESVIGQSYENIEILLINNLSVDGSEKIAKEYALKDNRIRQIYCNKKGLAATRNLALTEAKGTYIMFVDSDDILLPKAVWDLYQETMDETDFVMGSYYPFYQKLFKRGKLHCPGKLHTEDKQKMHDFFANDARGYNHSWGKLFKKDIFAGILFDENKLYEDIVVLPYIIENTKKIKVINKPVYVYRIHSDSITSSSSLERHKDGLDARIQNAIYYEKTYPAVSIHAYEAVLEFCFYYMGQIYGDGIEKNKHYLESVLACLDNLKIYINKTSLKIKFGYWIATRIPHVASWIFYMYSKSKNHL